jgi:hypothetical protein
MNDALAVFPNVVLSGKPSGRSKEKSWRFSISIIISVR